MSQPMTLYLTSASAATDAAWLAAADVAAIAAGLGVQYRLIGGIAVTLLVHHHQVNHLVPARETADADRNGRRIRCLTGDEIRPGLAEGLYLAPVQVSVIATLRDATDVDVTLHVPDARTALFRKAFAYRSRWSGASGGLVEQLGH